MTRAHLLLALLASVALTSVSVVRALPGKEPAFPHAKHERLFPVCEGCHGGVLSGDASDAFPTAAECADCHDDTRVKRVAYTPRGPRVSNLRFSHATHIEQTTRTGDPTGCRECHQADGLPSRMNVAAAPPERCVTCHEHRASTHLAATASCDRCHVPLTQAETLPIDRIAVLPKPDWHEGDAFVTTHGARAAEVSCQICHARETCVRCHANAERMPAVLALAHDTRVAALELGRRPTYPLPVNHADRKWASGHAAAAKAADATCANCHTPPSCTGCHTRGNDVIAALPAPVAGAAGGVSVRSRVHATDIASNHAAIAATGQLECTRCHAAATCAGCHAGSDSRAFHAPNFVERHATDVFARGNDCQSCHNTETFCRSCHERAGIAARSGMSAAFHDGQPMWVLSHGQAARTSMDSCASCHRQNDCVRCHSAAGGWGVNPHGPNYPASRIASRNTTTCQWCHAGNPLRGGR